MLSTISLNTSDTVITTERFQKTIRVLEMVSVLVLDKSERLLGSLLLVMVFVILLMG